MNKKGEKMSIRTYVLLIVGLNICICGSASASPYLSASTFGFEMDGWSNGSWGTTSLHHADASVDDDDWVDWTLSVEFQGSTLDGNLGAALLSHTIAPGPSRGGPAAGADASMADYFHIDPGASGLAVGTPVQIQFITGFNGDILLQGNPSGGCFVQYTSALRKYANGVILASLNTNSDVVPSMTSMYPAVDRDVAMEKIVVVNVNVGDVLQVNSDLSMDLNGSGYAGIAGYQPAGNNNLNFLQGGYARIGFAPGFEGLSIWSDGGANVLPEPMSLILLGLGSMLIRRRS
jgi:hypothetical protein